MEYDRYKGHNKLYILGIVSLILCVGFFLFSMFILPFLIWNLPYDVPEMISNLIAYFQYKLFYTYRSSATIVWMMFFIPSIITGFISYYASNAIDDDIYGITHQDTEEEVQIKAQEMRDGLTESAGLGFRILMLMILVALVVLLLQAII